MDIQRDRIIPVFIEEEMKDSYSDYSVSDITMKKNTNEIGIS